MKKRTSTRMKAAGLLVLATGLVGCGGSRENFVIIGEQGTVQAPAQPPTLTTSAVDDSFGTLGNAILTRTATEGVLSNDTLNGAEISAFDQTGSQGGTLSLQADGSLTYSPVFGFVGAETFTYTLSGDDEDSTATITFTSTNRAFFVDNSVAAGGNGGQTTPFDTLTAGLNAANSGDTVFVFRGDGTSTGLDGARNLPQGINLVGEGSGLVVAQTIVPQDQSPLLQGPLTTGGNNTISGFSFTGSATDSIVISGVSDVTVQNCQFVDPAEEHIQVNDASGTITISGCEFSDTPGTDYIKLEQNGVSADFVISGNTFTNTINANPDNAVDFESTGGPCDFNFQMSGNELTSIDTTNNFDSLLEIDADQSSGSMVFTVENNMIDTTSSDGFDLCFSSDVQSTGSVTGNTIIGAGSDGVTLTANGGVVTLANNVITGVRFNGLDIGPGSLGSTFIVEGNQITDSGSLGIRQFSRIGEAISAIRNNQISAPNTNQPSIEIGQDSVNGLNGTNCVVISGNTLDEDLILDNQNKRSFRVERFDEGLETFNTLADPSDVTPMGTITSVAAGTCNIP